MRERERAEEDKAQKTEKNSHTQSKINKLR